MSNYTDTFRKPAMTDETGKAIADKMGGEVNEYKVNTSAEFRKAPMSDETAREILAKIDVDGALSELSDVNLTNPSDGQVLHYDGTEWINATPVAELPAVTSDDNGDVLTVVEGAWAKATASGDIKIFDGQTTSNMTFKLSNSKTLLDIKEAILQGKIVILREAQRTYYYSGKFAFGNSDDYVFICVTVFKSQGTTKPCYWIASFQTTSTTGDSLSVEQVVFALPS